MRQVKLEAMKLMLQVAMADGVLGDEETVRLLSISRRLGTQDAFKELLAACARGELIPSPDLELLEIHRGFVLDLAREVALADGSASESERDFLEIVENLLG